jgi:signal transduction histidine kinase
VESRDQAKDAAFADRLERLALTARWILLAAVTGLALLDPASVRRHAPVLLLVAVAYLGCVEVARRRPRASRLLPAVTAFGDVTLVAASAVLLENPWSPVGLWSLIIAWNGLRHGQTAALMVTGGIMAVEAGGIFLGWRSFSAPGVAGEGLGFVGLALLAGYLGDRRRADEARLDRLAKLEEDRADRTGTLSHELRTPLAMIKTAAELMLDGRPGPTTTIQTTFLQMISGNVERLIALSEDLLAGARVDVAWLTMQPKPLDVRPLIRETVASIRPLIAPKRQTLRFDHPQVLSPALADPRWLQQVVINLIYNASKHTPDEGAITVTARDNEAWVLVSVTDTGSGLAEGEREHVFEKFYQGTGSPKGEISGVGLGLAIVRHVIEKQGGRVYMGSMLGRGSTVSFTLPKASKERT